jgi:catecholate siderophore receptor
MAAAFSKSSCVKRAFVSSLLILLSFVVMGKGWAGVPEDQAVSSGAVDANAPVEVSGVVVDASGAMVPGAAVRFSPVNGTPIEVTADSAGAFHVLLKIGHYQISAVQTGYEQQERPLELASSSPTRLTLTLKIKGNVESITVVADVGYTATSAITATRVPMSLLDTPQSIYAVTSQLIEDRGAESLKDALTGVPGVQAVSLGEGRRDQVLIRGFSASTDTYIDGVKDDAPYFRDLSNTDRIEVVEGPAAVLYGRGSSGGLINRVTKQPQMEGLRGQIGFLGGSYGDKRFESDVADSWLSNKLGVRLTGAAEKSGSQRDFFYLDRYAWAPTVRWQPNDRTQVYAQWERLRDEREPDRGLAAISGPQGVVPIGTNYGYVTGTPTTAPHNFSHTSATDETLDIKHEFVDGWHVHNVFRQAGDVVVWSETYLNEDLSSGIFGTDVRSKPGVVTLFSSALANASGSSDNPILTRGQTNATQSQQNVFDQAEAYRSGKFLGMEHLLLVGAEYGRQTQDRLQFTGTAPSVTLYNPDTSLAPTLSTTPSTSSRGFFQTAAVYTQDLMQLAPKWKLLAGVRFDNFKQNVDNRLPGATSPSRVDNDFSPRVGLLFQPVSSSTVYFSYSRTFDPSGEGLSLSTSSADLPPQVTTNYEVGMKVALMGDKLTSAVAIYDLDRTNILQVSPTNPNQLIQVGEQRTLGATWSVQGSITPHLIVYGGYSWNDAVLLNSPTTFNGVSYNGKRPNDVPVNSGSLWTTYSFKGGFGAGGGLVFNTDSFAADDNLVQLPGYTRLDAMFFYRKRHVDVTAHLDNLTNTRYYDTGHSDLEIFPGAPISGSVNLKYRF